MSKDYNVTISIEIPRTNCFLFSWAREYFIRRVWEQLSLVLNKQVVNDCRLLVNFWWLGPLVDYWSYTSNDINNPCPQLHIVSWLDEYEPCMLCCVWWLSVMHVVMEQVQSMVGHFGNWWVFLEWVSGLVKLGWERGSTKCMSEWRTDKSSLVENGRSYFQMFLVGSYLRIWNSFQKLSQTTFFECTKVTLKDLLYFLSPKVTYQRFLVLSNAHLTKGDFKLPCV